MFPSPFPTNNPSIAGAESAASSSAQVYNGLQAALSQRAALVQRAKDQKIADQQKSLQQDVENHLKAANEGWLPAETYATGGPAPGRPTLMTPEANPAAQGQGQTYELPDGSKIYKPTPAEAEAAKLNDSNSFSLSEAVAEEARKLGLTNVQAGVRYPKADAEFINQRIDAYHKANAPEPETFTYNNKDFVDENGNRVLALTGNRGTVKRAVLPGGSPGGLQDSLTRASKPGSEDDTPNTAGPPAYGFRARQQPAASPSASNDSLTFTPPPKPTKDTNLQRAGWTQDGRPVTFNPASGEYSIGNRIPGIADQAGGSEKPKLSASQARLIVQAKQSSLSKAQSDYKKALATAITPEDRQTALQDLRSSSQAAQLAYEESIGAATGREVPHNPWADSLSNGQATGGQSTAPGRGGNPQPAVKPFNSAGVNPQQPGPTALNQSNGSQSAPKVASLADVRAFAATNKISDSEAIRRAQKLGWKIQGK